MSTISRGKQFARCKHCGTVHNVSRWFKDHIPPRIVEVYDRVPDLGDGETVGTVGMLVLGSMLGLGLFGITFAEDLVGPRPNTAFLVARIAGILFAGGTATALVIHLFRRR